MEAASTPASTTPTTTSPTPTTSGSLLPSKYAQLQQQVALIREAFKQNNHIIIDIRQQQGGWS